MIRDYEKIKSQLAADIVSSQNFTDQQPVKFGKPLVPIKKTHAVVLCTVGRENSGRHVYETFSCTICLRFKKVDLPAEADPESFLFAQADALVQKLAPYVEDKDSILPATGYADVGAQRRVTSVAPVYEELEDSDSLISIALEFSCLCVVYQ